jgi:hypothetical protein
MSKSAHVAVSTPTTTWEERYEIFVRQPSEIVYRHFPEGCCLVTSLITLGCAWFVRRGVEQQTRDILKYLETNGLVSNVTKNANADAVAANAKTKPGGATLYRTVAPGSDDEDNSDSETKKTVVKKKVDRPRQIDTPVLNAREPPKKRGRPRKSPVHTEHIDDDDARPKNTGKKGGQGTDDTPKRTGTPEKKRGRPPKSPGRTDDTPNATGTPKKKRGRPPKNPEHTDDTPETTGTPKKKRGRPRKNPEHTDDTPKKKQIRTDEIPR